MKRILATLLITALSTSAETVSSSSSQTTNSYTDASGNTVTITTTERDGVRETRKVVTGPGGKVISDTKGDAPEDGDAPAQPAGGPWLGIHTAPVPAALRAQLDIAEEEGLVVERLAPDSPAGRAGIRENDLLLSFNLTPVNSAEKLRAELAKSRPGEKALVDYLRKGQREKAAITLGKRGESKSDDAPPAANLPADNGGGAHSSSRTVIVGPDGKTQVIESGGGDPFERMLDDPNVPETMKDSLRKMQEQMREFKQRADDMMPGAKKQKPAKGL